MQPVARRRRRSTTRGGSSPSYVSGRGPVPAVRVGRQPYGILPTTALAVSRLDPRRGPPATRPFLGELARPPPARDRRRLGGDGRRRVARRHGAGDAHRDAARRPRPAPGVGRVPPALRREPRRPLQPREPLRAAAASLARRAASASGYDRRRPRAAAPARLRRRRPRPTSSSSYSSARAAAAARAARSTTARCRRPTPVRATRPTGATTSRGSPTRRARRSRRCGARTGFSDDSRRRRCSTCCCATRCCSATGTPAVRLQLDGRSARRQPRCARLRRERRVRARRRRRPRGQQREPLRALYSADAAVTGDAGDCSGRPHHRRCSARRRRRAAPATSSSRRSTRCATCRPRGSSALLAEHLDTCAYRLDAWLLGLVNHQLRAMRDGASRARRDAASTSARSAGSRTCARSRASSTPVEPRRGPRRGVRPGDERPPLMRDSTNGGYIHAPSLNHAVTAAVLRSGYLANATPATPDALAVEPHRRERVRLGARACSRACATASPSARCSATGSSAACTTATPCAEVDEFISRCARRSRSWPTGCARHRSERRTSSIEAIEARNVVDGLRARRRTSRQTGDRTYPFGLPALPRRRPRAQAAAIDAEVDAAARRARRRRRPGARRGRAPGGAGQLRPRRRDARRLTAGPRSRRSRRSCRRRAAASRSPIGSRSTSTGRDPLRRPSRGRGHAARASAEPAVNAWLATLLPAPASRSRAASTWHDPATGAPDADVVVTQADLGCSRSTSCALRARRRRPGDERARRPRRCCTWRATAGRAAGRAARASRYTTRVPGAASTVLRGRAAGREPAHAAAARRGRCAPSDVGAPDEATRRTDAAVHVPRTRRDRR